MNQEKIKQLNPEKRKNLILQLLRRLTRRRDRLEDEIKQLCRLWDETVSELNGRRSVEGQDLTRSAKVSIAESAAKNP